jgi:hypothetical protein
MSDFGDRDAQPEPDVPAKILEQVRHRSLRPVFVRQALGALERLEKVVRFGGKLESQNAAEEAAAIKLLVGQYLRLFDLVRYMRAELHQAGLLDDMEYEFVCVEGATGNMAGSVERLSTYDDIMAKLSRQNQVFELCKTALQHSVPGDCYATGPLTGDRVQDLLVCPGCAALAAIAKEEKLAIRKAESKGGT